MLDLVALNSLLRSSCIGWDSYLVHYLFNYIKSRNICKYIVLESVRCRIIWLFWKELAQYWYNSQFTPLAEFIFLNNLPCAVFWKKCFTLFWLNSLFWPKRKRQLTNKESKGNFLVIRTMTFTYISNLINFLIF